MKKLRMLAPFLAITMLCSVGLSGSNVMGSESIDKLLLLIEQMKKVMTDITEELTISPSEDLVIDKVSEETEKEANKIDDIAKKIKVQAVEEGKTEKESKTNQFCAFQDKIKVDNFKKMLFLVDMFPSIGKLTKIKNTLKKALNTIVTVLDQSKSLCMLLQEDEEKVEEDLDLDLEF